MSVVKQGLQRKMLCSPNRTDSTKHPVYSLYTHFRFVRSVSISKAHCYQQIHFETPLAPQGSVNENLIDVTSSISIIKVFPGEFTREAAGVKGRAEKHGGVSAEQSSDALLFALLLSPPFLLLCLIKSSIIVLHLIFHPDV